MTQLALIDAFDKAAAKFAIVATYDFDALFFERRMLRTRGFASAERILILMDRGRYQALIQQGLPVAGFNRRYLVVPIDRSPQVFHPKLYLLLGDRRATGAVGSCNCTNAGIGHNMELCSMFVHGSESSGKAGGLTQSVLRQIYRTLQRFTATAGPVLTTIEAEFFKPIEEQHPWLHRNVVELGPKGPVEVLHSHDVPLWPQLKERLASYSVSRIAILAPFYDRDLGFLKLVRAQWPAASLSILAQEKYATLEGKKLAPLLSSSRRNRLLAVTPPPGRRLHAKAFAFETPSGTFWMTGSANATLPAVNGRNTEAVLWFASEEPIEHILTNDLTIEPIDPLKFERGAGDEPASPDGTHAADLHIASAILNAAGALELSFEASPSVRDVALRIRNVEEPSHFLSLRVRQPSTSSATFELEDSQIAQIRGAAICELKGVRDDREIQSNRIALVQLNQLLKERTASSGSRNPLQRIAETGEGLVQYLDSLPTVPETIEFLRRCNIKYDDGASSHRRTGAGFWKPRDPFVSDKPSGLLDPIGKSMEELRDAVWEFVQRHQSQKLEKHVRRGNLNGLSNFLDIFRTLNQLLLTYNSRTLGTSPIIPHPYVTNGMLRNLAMLMGEHDADGAYQRGFIDAVRSNFEGDRELVRERMQEEGVPQILRAAVEAMIEARRKGRKLKGSDAWATAQLTRVSLWIERQGLTPPGPEDVRSASMEYTPRGIAA